MKKFCTFSGIFFGLLFSVQILAQGTLQLDELLPECSTNDAKFNVTATVMDNDTWCRVTWPGYYDYWTMSFDDGEADDYIIFSNPGSINANKFTPWFYPAEVTGGEIYVGNGSFPGPFLGTLFRVMIFNDDGVNGLPGTVLDSMDVAVENYFWVEFEGLSVVIDSGSFYLGMKQLSPSPDAAPVGVDTDYPTYYKSYSYLDGFGWITSPLQDFMIRARIASGNNNGDVDYYQVDRFSNFDPNGSPLLGDTTFLGNVVNPYFNDFGWAPLPMGWYAYGVKEHYIDGGWSEYNLSNLAGHMTSFTININITLCDTLGWQYTIVKVDGEEVPAVLNPGGATATLEFNSPFPVSCEISVYCPGNQYYANYFNISPDEVINIPLMCLMYPARNLSVDPVSMIATWDPPQVMPLEQNFETEIFPPPGWQMLSEGNGWFRTDDGSGEGWDIPAWNSDYACTNDLLNDGNDGSMDYLVTPALHLDYRPDYTLSFDGYFDGYNGQSAYIEYTVDGEVWDLLYEVDPSTAWENIELDLVGFSGLGAPPQISFAFHADDNGQDASGWALDNVRIYSPDPPYTLDGYWVYIDDSLFAVTDTELIDLSPLTYGEYYTVKVKAHYPSGLSIPVTDTVFCEYLYPPSCFYQENNSLLIVCEPLDTNGNMPDNLLGLQIYRDMEPWAYFSFVPEPPPLPIEIILDEGPGIYIFSLTAVYDLTQYGFPGETGESGFLNTEVVISYGYPLPFLEQWNLGTFETNNWLPESESWSINWQEGQPNPSAQFTWDPIQAGYQIALESYPLLADSLTAGQLWLDFDLRLENYHPTGTEQMLVQVWNWESQVWSTVSTYSNIDGSFDWVSEHLEITDQVMGSVFKIRFAAKGENSLNILGWYVDNIHAYRACNPPLNLDANLIQNPLFTMILNWEAPEGTSNDQWIEWDDGVNYSAVGVGAAMPFDVAARWKPEQLSDFAGDSITQIAFIPTASSSTYRARVWIGEMAENLIVDQEEISPVIGEWNIISLLAPVPLDIYQDLWVGYQNDGPNGYQMGVDDGPAIDGYGNMLKFGPTWWTLLEINPELDYNWNIQAFLKHNIEDDTLVTYAIYRSDNGMPYYLRDYTENTYYDDDSAMCEPLGSSHFYKISALYAGEADTCESVFSNEAGDICEGTDEMTELSILNLYPNPATDMLFIETAEEIINVSLFDSRGGQVVGWYGGKVVGWYGGKVVGWYGGMVKVEVPVSGLAPGLYLVRIRTDEAVVSRKIIVQK